MPPRSYAIHRLAHVGNYPGPRPSGTRSSMEGEALSVSIHPDAWRQIAHVRGPTVVLERCDGRPGRFVDGRAALSSAIAWGFSAGLLQEMPAWEVSWLDEDTGDERFVLVNDRKTAKSWRSEQEDAVIERTTVAVEAGAFQVDLVAAFGTSHELRHPCCLPELINRYVATTDPDADGVWYDDQLEPDGLSAPRGGILPHRLVAWRVVEVRQPGDQDRGLRLG
jgi:hypothetical protein